MKINKTCKNCDAYNTLWHPTEFAPKCEMTGEILENTEACDDWGPNRDTEILFLRQENRELRIKLSEETQKKNHIFKRLHLAKRDNRHNRNKLRRQLEQATKHSFTDEQLWSFDYHLAKVILPALVRFKQINMHSFPGTVTEEEWSEILDKMIWSFNELANDEPNYPFPYDDDVSKNWGTTQEERKTMEEYFRRKKEGFELFGRYFTSLWD